MSGSEDYARFAAIMSKHGYDWEAHKITTEDDYILTTFHVLGRTGEDRVTADKGSVLAMHGGYQDAANWLEGFYDSVPFHLQLADAGYDVWIGNNRGTEYSQGHKSLDSKTDGDFWKYSW